MCETSSVLVEGSHVSGIRCHACIVVWAILDTAPLKTRNDGSFKSWSGKMYWIYGRSVGVMVFWLMIEDMLHSATLGCLEG